jgi:hypothetical protein
MKFLARSWLWLLRRVLAELRLARRALEGQTAALDKIAALYGQAEFGVRPGAKEAQAAGGNGRATEIQVSYLDPAHLARQEAVIARLEALLGRPAEEDEVEAALRAEDLL